MGIRVDLFRAHAQDKPALEMCFIIKWQFKCIVLHWFQLQNPLKIQYDHPNENSTFFFAPIAQ